MSTTLHERPPATLREPAHPRLEVRRPTALDRLALRVGLWLITYGRHRNAPSRERLELLAATQRERVERERAWERERILLRLR